MTVLVAYASAHSSASRIAQQIADRLLKSGFAAAARPVGDIVSLQPYRAVVLGSHVRQQVWLPEAAEFLHRFVGQFAKLPVWLFSSGSSDETSPKGAIRRTGHESQALTGAPAAIRFRDQRHFAGAFERAGSNPFFDLFSKVCGGSPADKRDWREINEWAASIARELQGIDHVKERRRLHLSVRGKPQA